MSVRVKICGITKVYDAKEACSLGVDAIGLVFCKSSQRVVCIEQACRIVSAVSPFVTVVGLFVNAADAEVWHVLNSCSLDLLQFHGEETPAYCRQFNRPYIKAIRVKGTSDVLRAVELHIDARAILVDAYVPGNHGGTGICFDWHLLPTTLSQHLILSGGLTPENVAQAIHIVQPAAVDVSSGVEYRKGIKDAAKMAAFISGAKNAFL